MKIKIDSELPISKGVGSSASYSVSIASSLLVTISLKDFAKILDFLGKSVNCVCSSY